MVYRLILPDWALNKSSGLKKVLEGRFTEEQVAEYNRQFYNCYFLPNFPSTYESGTVSGQDIDTFNFVFVDMDLKEGKYATKEEFLYFLRHFKLEPTSIVDSGNGIHAYWNVSDLNSMTFLKLQRRLIAYFNTDDAVAKIYQLMRVPGTVNTKKEEDLKICEILESSGKQYTCEDLHKALPPITRDDLEYCKRHHDQTYNPRAVESSIKNEIPLKFADLLRNNDEVRELFVGDVADRSIADFRLGHLMLANGLTADEAKSVLVNSRKALERAPIHRINYATNIVDKVYAFETVKAPEILNDLSSSVKDILSRDLTTLEGTRFHCSKLIDATEEGFRLTQVLGLVGGAGSGKTTFALNLFRWFVQFNPDYTHFFVTLEQPENEIAKRWSNMCGSDTSLHEKVEVLGNYNKDGSYRNLSLTEIKTYILEFQKKTGKKVGCVVIDHIGVLKKKSKNGESQALIDICHEMKSFAVETNTFLVMQSQTSREKAGIGDLELDKDAAYGTTTFEWYVDYLLTIWQPLKRVYHEAPDMTTTAFKFCKIRHKNVKKDLVKEDTRYKLMFDTNTEMFRELTQKEEQSFSFFNIKAVNLRKKDRKTDILEYSSITWNKPKEAKT